METVTAPLFEMPWGFNDFPHTLWPQAILEVNDEVVLPEMVEFGVASTGQRCLVITFEDGSKLNIWLDPGFPRKQDLNYAVWKNSPFHDLTLSTCPAWRLHRCPRCKVTVEAWDPPDRVSVDLKFCECDSHKRLQATPHAHVAVRTRGFVQKQFNKAFNSEPETVLEA